MHSGAAVITARSYSTGRLAEDDQVLMRLFARTLDDPKVKWQKQDVLGMVEPIVYPLCTASLVVWRVSTEW